MPDEANLARRLLSSMMRHSLIHSTLLQEEVSSLTAKRQGGSRTRLAFVHFKFASASAEKARSSLVSLLRLSFDTLCRGLEYSIEQHEDCRRDQHRQAQA